MNILISLRDSILIFASGLIMSISPGKVGELLKAFLIKDKYHISKSITFSVVLAERFIEFIALVSVSLVGVLVYNYGYGYVAIFCIIFSIFMILGLNQNLKLKIIRALTRSSYLKNRVSSIDVMQSSLTQLFAPILFVKMLLLSIVAWIIEFIGIYIILDNFNGNIDLMYSTFVYSLSIIIGAVSMLPGGIGATEGSLTYLLTQFGFSDYIAITSTLLIRISTLWFSVFIGFIGYIFFIFSNKRKSL
jgi:glycosyltransferase 2 family protein